jgi:hypothetical protein
MRDKSTMTWLLLVILLVALVTVACLSFRGGGAGPESASIPNFTPDPQNDKVILVKGWNEAEIQKIIDDFIETYKNDGYLAYTIEPHKQSENLYRLTFPQDIHPLPFTFLVNYIAYPFDLDYKNRSITVCGKTTLNAGFEGIDSSLVGKKAILYIPENDQDYNVIYMQTESGINLLMSFDSLKWRRVNDARLSNEVKNLIGGS